MAVRAEAVAKSEYQQMNHCILLGDALEQLQTLAPESIHTCITSPPYYNLRDYGTVGQIGMEKTPDECQKVFEIVAQKPMSTFSCCQNRPITTLTLQQSGSHVEQRETLGHSGAAGLIPAAVHSATAHVWSGKAMGTVRTTPGVGINGVSGV